jgi:guanosine-3',5'-bis(diphosphate) 3'-pyrophosphohydrolase
MVECKYQMVGNVDCRRGDAAEACFQAENEGSAAKRYMNGDKQMIQKAALFAAKAHEGMIRKGSRIPYIYHPMEVALIVAQMTDDPEVIAAAYLHDVLEDTSVTPEELEQNFGNRVLSFVMAESEDKSRTWRERKASTIAHLKRAPREVKLLTLGDKLSNMRSTARDYMVIGDEIWQRFNEKHRECHQWYLEGIMDGLQELRELPPFQELERLYHLVYES